MLLSIYIQAAMKRANYELLEDGSFYGEIQECPGVWGNATTLELCQEDLQDALEGWIILGLRLGHTLPIIDEVDLNLVNAPAHQSDNQSIFPYFPHSPVNKM
jgi:predicted RNase H-like HicB family nuclease